MSTVQPATEPVKREFRSRGGFLQLRRGLWDHLRDGRMTQLETLAFIYICTQADTRTGVWSGSAGALVGEIGFESRTARDVLERMECSGYIRRFTVPGSHICYPIVVHKYLITTGEHDGKQLDALNCTFTNGCVKLAFLVCEDDVKDNGEDNGEDNASLMRSKNREKRKREKKERPAAAKTAAALSPEVKQLATDLENCLYMAMIENYHRPCSNFRFALKHIREAYLGQAVAIMSIRDFGKLYNEAREKIELDIQIIDRDRKYGNYDPRPVDPASFAECCQQEPNCRDSWVENYNGVSIAVMSFDDGSLQFIEGELEPVWHPAEKSENCPQIFDGAKGVSAEASC